MSFPKLKKNFKVAVNDWKEAIGNHLKQTDKPGTTSSSSGNISQNPAAPSITSGQSTTNLIIPSTLKPSLIESAIQAQILQIWTEFLSTIYEYKITKYLEGYRPKKIDKESIKATLNFKKIDKDTKLTEFIGTGCKTNFESFTFPRQFDEIKRIFEIGDMDPYKTIIMKHIIVRNLFQHHQGKYVKKYVEDYDGFDEKRFQLIDDNSTIILLIEGQELNISCKELIDLCKAIEQMIDNIKFY